MSKNTRLTSKPLSIEIKISWVIDRSWFRQESPDLNQDCFREIRLLSKKYCWVLPYSLHFPLLVPVLETALRVTIFLISLLLEFLIAQILGLFLHLTIVFRDVPDIFSSKGSHMFSMFACLRNCVLMSQFMSFWCLVCLLVWRFRRPTVPAFFHLYLLFYFGFLKYVQPAQFTSTDEDHFFK